MERPSAECCLALCALFHATRQAQDGPERLGGFASAWRFCKCLAVLQVFGGFASEGDRAWRGFIRSVNSCGMDRSGTTPGPQQLVARHQVIRAIFAPAHWRHL